MNNHSSYIGLGSNQQQPQQQLQRALEALKNLPDSKLITCSSFYQSSPLATVNSDNAPQPDYINAVAKLETRLPPLQLLQQLQAIEDQQGRVRDPEQQWSARTLDLDLLLYDDKVIHSQMLVIPHYAMKSRDFVLQPLFEIEPELILPEGDKLGELLENCANNNLKKLD